MRKGLLLCLMVTFAQGAETVGWRIPFELLLGYGVDEKPAVRMNGLPAESAFFKQGDQLSDVQSAVDRILGWALREDYDPLGQIDKVPELKWEGEWLVWNERSEMLVARGEWDELALMSNFVKSRDLPMSIQTEFELPGPRGKPPVTRCLVSRSGEGASATFGEGRIHLVSNADASMEVLNITVDLDHRLGKGTQKSSMALQTTVTVDRGVPLKLASWTRDDGSEAWIQIKTEVVAANDVPIDDLCWIERNEGVHRLDAFVEPNDEKLNELELPEGIGVRRFFVHRDMFRRISGHRDSGPFDSELDPFAVPENHEAPEKADPEFYSLLKVPKVLQGIGLEGLFDVSRPLKANGVSFTHELALAGWSRRSGSVVLINDPGQLDLVESIFMSGCVDPPSHIRSSFSWDESSVMLVSRSGEKATLVVDEGNENVVGLEVAGNFGQQGCIVDLNYELTVEDTETWAGSLTLLDGYSHLIGSSFDGSKKREVRVTADLRDSPFEGE